VDDPKVNEDELQQREAKPVGPASRRVECFGEDRSECGGERIAALTL
jgi:hypothetical protein